MKHGQLFLCGTARHAITPVPSEHSYRRVVYDA